MKPHHWTGDRLTCDCGQCVKDYAGAVLYRARTTEEVTGESLRDRILRDKHKAESKAPQTKRWIDIDEIRRDIAAQAKAMAMAAGLEGVSVRVTVAEPDKRGRRLVDVSVALVKR